MRSQASDPTFRAWLTNELASASHAAHNIPLIGLDDLDLKDAQIAPLISVLADIIESACVLPIAVPTTHASAA